MTQPQQQKGTTSDKGEVKGTGNSLDMKKSKLSTRESAILDATPNILWYSLSTKYKGGGQWS